MAKQHPPSDEELVLMAKRGDPEAFSGLYLRYFPLVYNRVRYVIPDEDVEDITQEVFLAVLKSLSGFRGEARFTTWLRTLINRRVADYYRRYYKKEGRHDPETEGRLAMPGTELAISEETTQAEERIALRRAYSQLPNRYREILILRFAEELPFHGIAGLSGQSLEATKSLFRRAIAALRNELKKTDV